MLMKTAGHITSLYTDIIKC